MFKESDLFCNSRILELTHVAHAREMHCASSKAKWITQIWPTVRFYLGWLDLAQIWTSPGLIQFALSWHVACCGSDLANRSEPPIWVGLMCLVQFCYLGHNISCCACCLFFLIFMHFILLLKQKVEILQEMSGEEQSFPVEFKAGTSWFIVGTFKGKFQYFLNPIFRCFRCENDSP